MIFHFGYEAKKNLIKLADNLAKICWKRLKRSPKYQVKTKPRKRPDNVKEEVVRRREYENQILQYEDVAEFEYKPTACKKTYRMIVLRKKIRVEKGQQWLFDKSPYLFGSSAESAGKFEAESSGVAIKEPLGNLNNKA